MDRSKEDDDRSSNGSWVMVVAGAPCPRGREPLEAGGETPCGRSSGWTGATTAGKLVVEPPPIPTGLRCGVGPSSTDEDDGPLAGRAALLEPVNRLSAGDELEGERSRCPGKDGLERTATETSTLGKDVGPLAGRLEAVVVDDSVTTDGWC